MKNILYTAMLGFAMTLTAAAQTGGGSAGGTGSGAEGASSQGATSTATSPSPSTDASSQGSMTASSNNSDHKMKTEKLKGCVQSQGSGYALVDKKHPSGVMLSGSQDFSAFVGKKVEVKGTWGANSMSSMSGSSTMAANTDKDNHGMSGSTASGDKTITDANVKSPTDQPVGSTSASNTNTTSSTTTTTDANATQPAVTADSSSAVPTESKGQATGATSSNPSDTNTTTSASASTSGTSGSAQTTGSYGSTSNSSALPQSDQGSMQSFSVTEIKDKGTCDMANTSNPSSMK